HAKVGGAASIDEGDRAVLVGCGERVKRGRLKRSRSIDGDWLSIYGQYHVGQRSIELPGSPPLICFAGNQMAATDALPACAGEGEAAVEGVSEVERTARAKCGGLPSQGHHGAAGVQGPSCEAQGAEVRPGRVEPA